MHLAFYALKYIFISSINNYTYISKMNVNDQNQYRYYRAPQQLQRQPVQHTVDEKPKELNVLEYVTQLANSINERLTRIETILK
jgi:hypothetical protein